MEQVKDLAVIEQELSVKEDRNFKDAMAIKVIDEATKQIAGAVVIGLKALLAEMDETFDPMIEANTETKRKAEVARKLSVQKKEQHYEKPKKALDYVLAQITAYNTAEQRRRDQEARAEQERIRKAEEARRLAEAERLEAEAKKLAESNPIKAAEIQKEAEKTLDTPIITPVVVAQKVDKIAGITTRKYWHAEVVDFSKVPDAYKVADQVKLNGLARALKDQAKVEGVRFFEDEKSY